MSTRKSIWAGLDRLEGKQEGSSYKHLEKEKQRQGYSKSKALHAKMGGMKKSEHTPKHIFSMKASRERNEARESEARGIKTRLEQWRKSQNKLSGQ